MYRDGNTGKILGRNGFFQVVNTFTRPGSKQKSCVDYVLASLVYEKFSTINRMFRGEISDVLTRKACLMQLQAVEEYLKFSYSSHISSDDIFHGTTQYLLKRAPGCTAVNLQSVCVDCLRRSKCSAILELLSR